MHHTARTTPGTSGVRHPGVAMLAAVVLTLLTALGLAGPAGTGGPTADLAAAAGHHRDTVPRADDGCGTTCTVRATTRQEPHPERPAPRCHPVTCGQGTAVTPPGPARLSTRTGHTSASEPRASHDRGRAPPHTSGT
ncbi:hypothetical protein [Streptomyces sp. B93]|uniref:hypothetical protein n=1 Tax=Streptomyces sp. B93 TaxID=2824875 RepID=UPI001B36B867|nr:hypothetical protein [Streptomyces sp. B93]MBQ1093661.1 hypothetical protein [Streptomyces sp. B93]